MVHRDLKPENVLLAPGDPVPLLKLVDFGIARRPPAHAHEKPLTSLGTVLGTPAFMCPEQLRGQPVDARADVYALALLTYLMLTGTLPWPARTLAEWTDAHLNLPPRPLRQQPGCAALPAAFEHAIAHALEKDADRRTATAAAFLTELRGEGASEPAATPVGSVATVSLAAAPSPPSGFGAFASTPPPTRRRVLRWALGIAAVGLSIGFALVWLALRSGAATRPPAAAPAAPIEDPVARASREAQSTARAAVAEGGRRVQARDLDGAIAALRRARSPAVLPGAEVDPLRDAVDELGAAEMRRRIRQGDCRAARALLGPLQSVGASSGSQARLDHSTCGRH